MLTEEQKKKSLDNPHNCPHCDSDDLTTISKDSDYNQVWHGVQCEGCEKTWKDIYTLTDIEED